MKLLSKRDVQERLSVSLQTLNNWTTPGSKYFKTDFPQRISVGRSVRFSSDALDAWVAAQLSKSPASQSALSKAGRHGGKRANSLTESGKQGIEPSDGSGSPSYTTDAVNFLAIASAGAPLLEPSKSELICERTDTVSDDHHALKMDLGISSGSKQPPPLKNLETPASLDLAAVTSAGELVTHDIRSVLATVEQGQDLSFSVDDDSVEPSIEGLSLTDINLDEDVSLSIMDMINIRRGVPVSRSKRLSVRAHDWYPILCVIAGCGQTLAQSQWGDSDSLAALLQPTEEMCAVLDAIDTYTFNDKHLFLTAVLYNDCTQAARLFDLAEAFAVKFERSNEFLWDQRERLFDLHLPDPPSEGHIGTWAGPMNDRMIVPIVSPLLNGEQNGEHAPDIFD